MGLSKPQHGNDEYVQYNHFDRSLRGPLSPMLINRILLLFTCCFCVLEAARAQSVEVPRDPAKFHLFLLAGQSNMAGRGKVSESDRKVDPHVLTLDKRESGWLPLIQFISINPAWLASDSAKTSPKTMQHLTPESLSDSFHAQ